MAAETNPGTASRRWILGLIANLGLCLQLPRSAAARGVEGPGTAHLWCDVDSAASIGASLVARRKFPVSEALRLALETKVRERLPLTLADIRSPEVRQAIQEAVGHDYRAGRIIHVEGWVLSEIEGLLFEYVHLCRAVAARSAPYAQNSHLTSRVAEF